MVTTPIQKAIDNICSRISKSKNIENTNELIDVMNFLYQLKSEERELIEDTYYEGLADVKEIVEELNLLSKTERYMKKKFNLTVKHGKSEETRISHSNIKPVNSGNFAVDSLSKIGESKKGICNTMSGI